jgi:hypothetical protein
VDSACAIANACRLQTALGKLKKKIFLYCKTAMDEMVCSKRHAFAGAPRRHVTPLAYALDSIVGIENCVELSCFVGTEREQAARLVGSERRCH